MLNECYHSSRMPGARNRATFDRLVMVQVLRLISLRSVQDFENVIKVTTALVLRKLSVEVDNVVAVTAS